MLDVIVAGRQGATDGATELPDTSLITELRVVWKLDCYRMRGRMSLRAPQSFDIWAQLDHTPGKLGLFT